MVEGTALEMRRGGNPTVGSNPTVSDMNKKIIVGIVVVILIITAGYFLMGKEALPPDQTVDQAPPLPTPTSSSIEYRNVQYGFAVTLPKTWEGYTVSTDKWTGNAANDQLGEVAFATGPVLSIHNPKWSGAGSYQDIPIMVFTLDQWSSLQKDEFHIGAAPIGPSEMGRNTKYVFALPARYNFAFPTGYEEVDQIIQSKPLKTF